MNDKEHFSELREYLLTHGIAFVTDIQEEGKGAAIANSYFLEINGKNYLIDPACGEKRLKQIKKHLPFREFDVLVTHSHLDHSANSGIAAGSSSRVIFHPVVEGRINNLKRNYTEITFEMVNRFGIEGFFGRTGIFTSAQVQRMKFIQKFAPPVFYFILYSMSLMMCRNRIGGIYPPKKKALFLDTTDISDMQFGCTQFKGWLISEGLFALDTPGHQDDHLSFYVPETKTMFSGDLIGFLNPNDILDGSIKDTHEGMRKMLQLAEDGGIEILAASHTLPVIGKERVIGFLRAIIEKQEETFQTVSKIVASCDNLTNFEEIISRIYLHDSDLMKKILKINYPRTVSFIDVYVYIFLKELENNL